MCLGVFSIHYQTQRHTEESERRKATQEKEIVFSEHISWHLCGEGGTQKKLSWTKGSQQGLVRRAAERIQFLCVKLFPWCIVNASGAAFSATDDDTRVLL